MTPNDISSPILRKERMGLLMIAASLLVITLTIGILLKNEQRVEEQQIRSQGISLIQLLAEIPPHQLMNKENGERLLKILYYSQQNSDFAYAAIVSLDQKNLAVISAPGIIMPEATFPTIPTRQITEQEHFLEVNEKTVLEFYAPILEEGNAIAYVRLGFTKPTMAPTPQQIAFFATLALPIFLLTPLFYLLLKQELQPLTKVFNKLEKSIESELGKMEIYSARPSVEFSDVMGRFNSFIELTQNRIAKLETDKERLLTSEKVLSYKRHRMEQILQTLPCGVLVLDESGVALFSNNKVEGLLGISPQEIIGKKIRGWCPFELLAILAKYEQPRQPLQTSFLPTSMEFTSPKIPDKTILLRAFPLFTSDPESFATGTLLMFTDVTQEALTRKSSAEFVAEVSHELKTPLSTLLLYANELLKQGAEVNKPFAIEAVNVIHDESERMNVLIHNLLYMTQIEMGSLPIKHQRVKARDFLKDCFDNIIQGAQGLSLHFKLDLPKEMSDIAADKELLRIAIHNLLTNAIKYNKEGGTVQMEAEEIDSSLVIKVSDTGVGIKPEDLTYIFEKFYRSSDEPIQKQKGHGLGLSLAKQIIELHRGNLTVKSTCGQGSEFTIQIPIGTEFLKQS